MRSKEWTRTWQNAHLGLGLLQAFYVDHAFPRHSHDYYVISLILRGLQSFTHEGTKHYTSPGGVILINPGAVHTGEAANSKGFEMLCLYPTTLQMQIAAFELTGHHCELPFFSEVRVDHRWARTSIFALHKALTGEASDLESESHLTWTLAQLIKHYADLRHNEQKLGKERIAIRRARQYIEEHMAQGVSLTKLAEHVSFSRYYLLRAFRAEVGLPPHAYLESLRVRESQRLIKSGKPLAEIAAEVGFSSQSHLTHRFKKIIGVTPGQYAQRLR